MLIKILLTQKLGHYSKKIDRILTAVFIY